MPLYLFNTLHRKKELFMPIHPGEVRMYTCGPTVYGPAHIGNLRAYIFSDVLKRTLASAHLSVVHAMNITDVGHLVGDGDDGEDKMESGARAEGLHPLEVAKKYETLFWHDFDAVGCERPSTVIRATDAIPEQLALIEKLKEKGFTYQTPQAIYFDTSKLKQYGQLSGQKLEDKLTGARDDVVVDTDKKHPADFALWFFLVGRYEHHTLRWASPWGVGFPGWHLECSAISREALGQPFDIHTGGVDHLGTHHPNEMAQSEAAYGEPLAHVWMHNEHLLVGDRKMSKSVGNLFTVSDITSKGFDAYDFRYLCLMAHYRSKMNFTWEALAAAQATRRNINALIGKDDSDEVLEDKVKEVNQSLYDDLDTPKALALLHEAKSPALWKHFDQVLNLGLIQASDMLVPEAILNLVEKRKQAREIGDWQSSDAIRDEIKQLGYQVSDTKDGQVVSLL